MVTKTLYRVHVMFSIALQQILCLAFTWPGPWPLTIWPRYWSTVPHVILLR